MSSKPPKGQFSMLYFASASTFTKKASENFPAPINTKNLYDFLENKYPGIKDKVLDSCAVTINLQYIDIYADTSDHDQTTPRAINEGDEVAIIPPVSSG